MTQQLHCRCVFFRRDGRWFEPENLVLLGLPPLQIGTGFNANVVSGGASGRTRFPFSRTPGVIMIFRYPFIFLSGILPFTPNETRFGG